MDRNLTIRVPRRLLRAFLVLSLAAVVIAPIAVSANDVFDDVPDTNTFYDDITWLADAAITLGCNPPANTNYCPDGNVTRGQMAAFMRRFAQYLDAEDGTPALADNATTADSATTADDAEMVDGYNANSLNRVAFDVDQIGSPVSIGGIADAETVLSVEITAPTGGYITVDGQIGLTRDAGVAGGAVCSVSVDDLDGNPGADILDGSRASYSDVDNGLHPCSSNAAFATWFGGTYTINFNVAVILDAVQADEGTLIVQFTPFNGEGGVPFGVIVIPPIITLGEIAEQMASTDPDIAARLPEILEALG